MSGKRKPARWRRAKMPGAGGRWDTPMNRHIWYRDHGHDIELWRDGIHLATVAPTGCWHTIHNVPAETGDAESVDEAKTKVKAVIARLDEAALCCADEGPVV